jgi:hypothetical protein
MFLPNVLWWKGRLLILLPLVITPLPLVLLLVLLPIFFIFALVELAFRLANELGPLLVVALGAVLAPLSSSSLLP